MPLGNGHNLPMVIAMPTLVQDEAGQLFIDTGGGVYHPVNEDQARAFQENPNMLENMGASAGQGLENLITGAGSLLSDDPYWQQANQAGRARSEALNLAQPVAGPLAQFAPQAAAGIATGIATGGASLPAQFAANMGVDALLGAATTPETPWQGAAFGAGTAALGVGAVPAARALMQRAPEVSMPGWFRNNAALDAVGRNPGGLRPGDLDSLGVPESSMLPRGANLADDMNAAPSQLRPGARAGGDAVGDMPLSPSANPPGIQQAVDDATARAQQAFQAGDEAGLREALIQQQQAQQRAAAARATPRMANRVAASLDEATDTRPRVLEGTMTPEELSQYGVPTSKAQQAMLRARAGGVEYEDALDALRKEEALKDVRGVGQNLRLTRDLQKRSATNFLSTELELPAGVNITDDALANTFQRLGHEFDSLADRMGGVEIDDGIRAQLSGVLENVTGDHAGQLQKYVREIEAKAARNGGELSGVDWQTMRTKLQDMTNAGQSQGNFEKIADAHSIMDVFTQALEAKLPAADVVRLQKIRKQYAIAQTLTKAGARDQFGVVNSGAFYRNWKRPQSKKMMAKDDVGRFMNTMTSLATDVTPNSGTAWRLGAGIINSAAQGALPAGVGGVVGNWLFGGN